MNGIESPALAVWKCIPYALYFAREIAAAGRKSGRQILGISNAYVGVRDNSNISCCSNIRVPFVTPMYGDWTHVGRATPDDRRNDVGRSPTYLLKIKRNTR